MIVKELKTKNFSDYCIGEGGRYHIRERLGGGGMGDVFLAMDTRLGKPVALKLLQESLANDETMRVRFELELSICATLKSQHIVQVSDYGLTDAGYPFYVMEYLQGQTLGQLLSKKKRLSPQQTCQIITQICAGLQLAHAGIVFSHQSNLSNQPIKVIHRDLKPENIFLVPTALGDLVKIIDFGIAKIRSLQAEHTKLTNLFLGTCHYAAPEQFEGAKDLDERADIYSLGLIIYEMLTGYDPFGLNFRENRISGESWLLAHVTKTPLPLHSHPHCQDLSPELEKVVMRCLAKSPQDRFSSVTDLNQALQTAVLGSNLDNSQALTRSRRVSLENQPTQLLNEPKKTKRFPLIASLLFTGGIITALTIGFHRFPQPFSIFTIPQKQSVANAAQFSSVQTLSSHQDAVWSVAVSADGQILVSGSEDKTIKIWNSRTGKLIRTLFAHQGGVRAVNLSSDGKMIVSGSADRTIKLWDISTGQLLHSLTGHQDTVWGIAISPDGKMIASASGDQTIKLWDVSRGKLLRNLEGHQDWVFATVFSPDGKMLASASKDGSIKLWDVETGNNLSSFIGHKDAVRAIAFAPQGGQLASASWDGTLKLWDLNTGKNWKTFSGHQERVVAVTFAQDGKTLISGSTDGTIKLWDWQNQGLLTTLAGHQDWVLSVANSPAGAILVSGSKDNSLKIWR